MQSTTDTTVKFHTSGAKDEKIKKQSHMTSSYKAGEWDGPHSFIITGTA